MRFDEQYDDGDNLTPDDAVWDNIRVEIARKRYALKQQGSPFGTCSTCGRSLLEGEDPNKGDFALCGDDWMEVNEQLDKPRYPEV